MEQQRFLDVPITEVEHRRRDSDREELLASRNTIDHAHNNEGSPTLRRFGSLKSTIYQVNNPSHAIGSSAVHERTPSDAHEQQPESFNFAQSTSYSHEGEYAPLHYPYDLWRPLWLRKSILAIFLALYLLIIVGLVLLWHFSHIYNGFHISSSVAYYAWTYAPVAFMIIVVSLWRQVDYYFKLLAPWDELRKGPVPASQSLLVDYVSPINVVSLFSAFKRGYIPVVMSIIVFFALKVITVFAPALFVSVPTLVVLNSTNAISTKVFDASSFNPSAYPNVSTFTPDPVYSTLGNVAYGLPYVSGVRSDFAYVPINIDYEANHNLENATYTAETDALFPTLSCVSLYTTFAGNPTVRANRTTVNTTNNYISLRLPNGNICSSWSQPQVYAMNPQRQRVPARQLEGTMQRVYCAKSTEEGSQPLEPAGLLFTVTDIRYSQYAYTNGTIINSTRSLSQMSNMLCIPGYYILKANINNSSAIHGSNAVNIQMSTVQNRSLEGLSKRNLAVLYDGIMDASRGIFGSRQDNTLAFSMPNTVFNVMSVVANESTLEPFLDGETMQKAAEETFRRVMSHYAAQSLTRPSQLNTIANVAYPKQKLHVSLTAFYVMLIEAALAALCTMCLLLVTPGPIVPRDPSMIAMSATVLARSPELNRILRRQIANRINMSVAMSEHQFGTAIATIDSGHSSFKIVVSEPLVKQSLIQGQAPPRWWTPNYLLLPAFMISAVLSVGLIVVLEIVQRLSDDHYGLATVEIEPYTALYIHSIPVLVMLCIAAMVGYLNFYVLLLSPWNKLDRGNSNPKRSVLSHLLGKFHPLVLLEALKFRHFGAGFAVLATMLASVTAIIASGLYSVNDIVTPGLTQEMNIADSFQMQNRYTSFNDRGAAGVVRMIGGQSPVYPDGTFDDLVFPALNRVPPPNTITPSFNTTTGPFTAIVPALRANLKCDIVSPTNFNVTYVAPSRTFSSARYRVDSRYELPAFCPYAGLYRNSSVLRFQNLFNTTSNSTTLLGGQLFDLVFGRTSVYYGNYDANWLTGTSDSPAVGCPSVAFTFVRINTDSRVFEVTPLVCYQQVQKLEANVTYIMNSTRIDSNHRPVVHESTVSLVSNTNSTNNAKSFDWRIQRNIERQLYGLNGDRLESPQSTSNYQFDAFFSYLFSSVWKDDPSTLAGTSNQQTLADTLNALYRKYMAQAINANMRISTSTSTRTSYLDQNSKQKRQSSQNPITLQTNVTRPRLVQDKASKLTIQILLGLTAIFSVLAYMLTTFHHLLPVNPCSIAGMMSMLAGSDLCWTPEDTLCDCCGKPRRGSWGLDHDHEHTVDSSEDTIVAADQSEYTHHHTRPPSSSIANSASSAATAARTSSPREQIIRDGAEWSGQSIFASIFAGRTYSLGWWKEDIAKGRRRRFGIDVGPRPQTEIEDGYELNERRTQEEGGIEDIMMRGRDMLGDQRGAYQRANAGNLVSPGPLYDEDTRAEMAPIPLSPPEPRIMSPRKVRFEDEA